MSSNLLTAAPARTSRWSERRVVALACGVLYLAVALWFWRHQLAPGDAQSRLANGYYVFYSRDPHLAAIGFVWNPLPSLILLPFLPLAELFPALTRQALLASLASAVLMTAAVAVAHDVLRRTGLRRTPRLLLTAALALHPMTVLYAGNGMSEACFLLCLLLAVRAFQRWLAEARVELLVPLGLALALAYGARYEALAPAAAVTVAVAAVTWFRSGPDRARRWALARADAVVVGLPPVLAFVLWAAASKIIVDQWFATFSSQYGNSTQVTTAAADIASVTGADLSGRTGYWLHQLLGLSPLAVLLSVIALVLAWRRRDWRVLAPITVLGSVLAFDGFAFLSGTSFGWLRFSITVVPLGVLVAGHLLAALPAAGPRRRVGTAAVLAAVVVAVPSTVVVLSHSTLAREEAEWVTGSGSARRRELTRIDARVAADLDAMRLPDGAVATDAAYAFGVVLASSRPRQFVITPDRDFAAAVGDPAGHRVRYLLLSANGSADAVRIARYGADPAAVPATGVRTWSDAAGGLQWTLVPVT